MFLAIPLESRPTWRNPPWMTVLLILVNMVVFWGPQRSEESAQARAAQFYAQTVLPALELPAFVAWLERSGSPHATTARRLLAHDAVGPLLEGLQSQQDFLRELHADKVILPAHPQYAEWQRDRRNYEALLPQPFTQRWAQDFSKDAEFRPATWLTAAFLHGSTAHLLGNMLFLFLFGFSVELALGRGTYLGFYLLGAIGGSLLADWAYGGKETFGHGLGASGGVAALMGMYAVMYRLRRIRFFYQLFFYFNYVTAPALILLPAWIANELLQHLASDEPVAYMAHLGGLLTGSVLMTAAVLLGRVQTPDQVAAISAAPDDGFDAHVSAARRLASEMKFEQASARWRAAAKLRPQDADTLSAWFNTARLWPAGEDFHLAAHRIFRLAAHDTSTLELQHASYRTYLDQAKPGARLKPEDMARLARRLTRGRHFDDADKLCHALVKTAPDHPELADTLSICANGLLQAGQRDRALHWLPHLQRLAPDSMVTRALQGA